MDRRARWEDRAQPIEESEAVGHKKVNVPDAAASASRLASSLGLGGSRPGSGPDHSGSPMASRCLVRSRSTMAAIGSPVPLQ
jgi:hypothetical protein